MELTFRHEIVGYLVGNIWMPYTECYKPFCYDITREDARFSDGPADLRTHVLRATNDGDFQSCAIADGELLTTATIKRGGRTYRRVVSRPLSQFPSIQDCLRDDWCGPDSGEE